MLACPAEHPVELYSANKVYAGWNTHLDERLQAASGGIATAIYQYALTEDISVYGVADNERHEPSYVRITSQAEINQCKNSKYVFSRTDGIYSDVLKRLREGKKVIFIGLPCQVAGLKQYLGKPHEGLVCVDIVCHGTCPSAYLVQHVKSIEKSKNKKAGFIRFRDPRFGTHHYQFTLSVKETDRVFYRAGADQADVYQVGYHKGLTYRTNCYQCVYARKERVGDITISDFSGLGRVKRFDGENISVSCILCNTDKGMLLLSELVERSMLVLQERPMAEAFEYEKMFQHPTIPHPSRAIFEQVYKETQSFETAAGRALHDDIIANMSLQRRLKKHIRAMKYRLRKMLPDRAVSRLKGAIKR